MITFGVIIQAIERIKKKNLDNGGLAMTFSYNKLWKQLIDKNMLKKDLIEKAGISPTTVAAMSKGKPVSLETLGKICELLGCNIGDIVEVVIDEKSKGVLS